MAGFLYLSERRRNDVKNLTLLSNIFDNIRFPFQHRSDDFTTSKKIHTLDRNVVRKFFSKSARQDK